MPLIDGDLTAAVKATDAAGNEVTDQRTFDLETANFVVEIESVSDGGNGDGVINATEHGSGGSVTVTGTGDAGTTVVLTIKDTNFSKEIPVDGDGNWTTTIAYTDIPTGEQTITIEATVKDQPGVPHQGFIDVDTIVAAPVVDESSTTDNNVTIGGVDKINLEGAKDGISLSGTAENGATVEVTFTTADGTQIATENNNSQ